MGDQVVEFNAAFVAAAAQLADIVKGQTADTGSYRYSYADLASVTSAVRPTLAAHGLTVAQDVTGTTDGMVEITTRVYHTGGHVEIFGPLPMPRGRGPQDTGSAITYGRRYSLMAALGLATEDDDGKQAQQAAERATEPHPNSARVTAMTREMKRLTDTAKTELKAWADGRSLGPSAMLDDEEWLSLVESWLDEHKAAVES